MHQRLALVPYRDFDLTVDMKLSPYQFIGKSLFIQAFKESRTAQFSMCFNCRLNDLSGQLTLN